MDENPDDLRERSKRIRKRFILRAAQPGEEPLRWSHCTIHNLSATGILFTYDRPVEIGAHLYLRIDFPDRLIECVGRVVRFAGTETGKIQDLGVYFVRMRDEDRAFVEAFVQSYKGQ